ncbi:MAG TPA: DoxX family protein [Pseudonocardia sp.]|jgi:putative oxidoreductase|uniref:DoxX family protein n=1 Tax=Pseudonocardia sp. TaxID=60912 RepID=UPI002B4AB5E3|nr:DoxX family protein [Pseudonocardia sp.]HLU56634.1 DoxX family protein [Pseudonocardia sp.]
MTDQPTSILPGGGGFGSPEPAQTRPNRRPLTWNPGTDVGLLLLRFAVGGTFFAHGMQIVTGMWGGQGLAGFTRVLEGFGYQQAPALAWVAGLTALVGGALVVLGFLTPLAAVGLLALMINSVAVKIGNGFFIASPAGADAVELDVVLGLSAAALALTGAGRIALDRNRTWNLRPAPWGVLMLIVGVTAAVLVLVLLR